MSSKKLDSNFVLDYESPHKKSAKRFRPNEYLLLGAGPANCSDRVLRAGAFQCIFPLSPEFYSIMDEVKGMLQYVFQTKNKLTLATQNSGNGGNEALVTNLLDPKEKLIVAIGGVWGEKVVDMAERHNVDVISLRKDPGEVFSLEELEQAVKAHKANVLFVTHGESSGGTLQRLEGLGKMCHKYDCLLAVDAIVSIAVEPLFVDRWEIDAVTAGSQKAIGAPPGMCMISLSPRAIKRMNEKKARPPYYFDLKKLGVFWKCFDEPREYHITYSSFMLFAVREALATICEEGLPQMWERHRSNMRLFWQKLDEIGLKSFVEKKENRFYGVTCVVLPEEIDQLEFLDYLRNKYRVDIVKGYGPTTNKAIRIGFLGHNSRPELVEYLAEVLKEALQHFKSKS